eukprot:COSAG06_NODE_22082_length_734_cov_1.759055_1_plen_112_part_01
MSAAPLAPAGGGGTGGDFGRRGGGCGDVGRDGDSCACCNHVGAGSNGLLGLGGRLGDTDPTRADAALLNSVAAPSTRTADLRERRESDGCLHACASSAGGGETGRRGFFSGD